MSDEIVEKVDRLIELLGGPESAAAALNAKAATLTVWKHRGRLPAARYLEQSEMLRQRGIVASPGLWGQHGSAVAA